MQFRPSPASALEFFVRSYGSTFFIFRAGREFRCLTLVTWWPRVMPPD